MMKASFYTEARGGSVRQGVCAYCSTGYALSVASRLYWALLLPQSTEALHLYTSTLAYALHINDS